MKFKSLVNRTFYLTVFALAQCYSEENECFQECEPDCYCPQYYCHLDALIWIPYISGLEWGFGSTNIEESYRDCTRVFKTEDKDVDPHFDLNLGFRVGLGIEKCLWVSELEWTHYSSTGNRRCHHSELGFTSGHLNIQLDQLDLTATYLCHLSDTFSMYPFIGLRGTYLKHKLYTDSAAKIFLNANSYTVDRWGFSGRQKYLGIGPLIGVGFLWKLNSCIELFSSLSGGLLYGKYNVHQKECELLTEPFATEVEHYQRKHTRSFDENLNFDLGFVFHLCSFDCFNLDLMTSIEHHQYLNQNRIGLHRGDISFTGGTCSFLFEF